MSKKKKSKKQNFPEPQDAEMNTVSATEMTGAVPANPPKSCEDSCKNNAK